MNGGDHLHGMGGMGSMNNSNGGMTTMNHSHHHMMMHMTFFWGKNTEILFSGWPGNNNLGMYILSLVIVFLLALLVEWLSHSNFIKETANDVVAGVVQTFLYCIRAGLVYMVMLAVMSFNGGVFIVAVAGHSIGFLFFGSRVFNKSMPPSGKTSDLPPMSC